MFKYTGVCILMMTYERPKHVGVNRLFMLQIFCWAYVGEKNPQHAFLGGEVKPSPMSRHVKEPWVYVEVEITGKIDRPFLARNSVFR